MTFDNVIEAIEKRFAELKTDILLRDIEISDLKKKLAAAETDLLKAESDAQALKDELEEMKVGRTE